MNRLIIQQQTLISPRSTASPLVDRATARKAEQPAEPALDRATSADRPATFARALQKKRKQADIPTPPDRQRPKTDQREVSGDLDADKVARNDEESQPFDDDSESRESSDSRVPAPGGDAPQQLPAAEVQIDRSASFDPLVFSETEEPQSVSGDSSQVGLEAQSQITGAIAASAARRELSGSTAADASTGASAPAAQPRSERVALPTASRSEATQTPALSEVQSPRVAATGQQSRYASGIESKQKSGANEGASATAAQNAAHATDPATGSTEPTEASDKIAPDALPDLQALSVAQSQATSSKPLASTAGPKPAKAFQPRETTANASAGAESSDEQSDAPTLTEAWSQHAASETAAPARVLAPEHAAVSIAPTEQPSTPIASAAVQHTSREPIGPAIPDVAATDTRLQVADEKMQLANPSTSLPRSVDLLGRLASEPLQSFDRVSDRPQAATPEFQRALNAQVQRGVEQAAAQAAASGAWAGASAAGSGSVMLRLHPANLGMLRVYLRMDGTSSGGSGGVKARFEVSSTRAKGILGSSIDSLRTALEERGLSMEEVTITDMPQMPERRFGLPSIAETARESGTSFADLGYRDSSESTSEHGNLNASGARGQSSAESGGVQDNTSVWESGEQPVLLAALSPSAPALKIGSDGRVFLNALV